MLENIQKEVEDLRVKVYSGQSNEDTEKALYEIEQLLFKAMDSNKKLDKEILRFLNTLANKTDNGYIWREACGLIKEIERVKKLTIPIVIVPTGKEGTVIPDLVGLCPSCGEEISRNGVFKNHNCKKA